MKALKIEFLDYSKTKNRQVKKLRFKLFSNNKEYKKLMNEVESDNSVVSVEVLNNISAIRNYI